MTPSTLVEHVADWHAHTQVDGPNRLVRNVALTGGTSKNGYRYAEQALREAASLYEQRPVFLDHAADKSRPQERSTRDLVGSVVNPRYEQGRIRGDIRVLDTDSGRTFLALVESDAPGVGMSHVVLAERATPDGEVSRIHDVVSVDAVVFPATTTTFRESLDATNPNETADTAHHQDAATIPQAESEETETTAQTTGLHVQLQQLLTERDELLARLHAEQRRQAAERNEQHLTELLSNSGLPDYAVTETFRRQLMAADDSQRRELIQERQTLIEAASRRPPVSLERPLIPGTPATSDTAFVAALKRRAS